MFDKNFYPTPIELGLKLLRRYTNLDLYKVSKFLEPSAGKCDLIKALNTKLSISKNDKKDYIHCVEIDEELQSFIRGEGYHLVGYDFLNFWTDTKYDFILMNPPFDKGLKHLYHAWEILDDGGNIACILPSGILDKNTKEALGLRNIFSKYGDIEEFGSAFVDAERKTKVEVSGYYLKKPETKKDFDFLKQEKEDTDVVNFSEHENTEIATRNLVGNLVADYKKCTELFTVIQEKTIEFSHYINKFNTGMASLDFFGKCLQDVVTSKSNSQRDIYNTFVSSLKKNAWSKIFTLTSAQNLMTEKVRKEFDVICEENKKMSFCEENIYNFIQNLVLNQENIMTQCVSEAFDLMTRYDRTNVEEYETFKTNDAYRINKKVIVPYAVEHNFGYPTISYSRSSKFNDIDRALAFIEGKKFDTIKNTINTSVREFVKKNSKNVPEVYGTWFESHYFRIKIFKKGTIHLEFKDQFILDNFNLIAAKGKNWLPYDYKYNEKMWRKNKGKLRIEA